MEHFLAFMKYDQKQEIEQMKQQFMDHFSKAQELAGYPATLQPVLGVDYAEES